jgi:ribosome recycling factor
MPTKAIHRDCKDRMDKSKSHLESELRGIRAGRATTALVDYIKIEYYGTMTDLRELAAISVPEPTLILIKPFDPTAKNGIIKGIEAAALGFNPMPEGDAIRITVPSPSSERRKQLAAQVKKMGEDTRVAIRNERRDANKQLDVLVKDKTNSVSEDDGKGAKSAIDEMTKMHIKNIDDLCDRKVVEVEAA